MGRNRVRNIGIRTAEEIVLHYVVGGDLIADRSIMRDTAVRWANGEYKDIDMRSFELYKGKVCPCSLKHDASLAAAHQAAYDAKKARDS
jgi:hypothetical protein